MNYFVKFIRTMNNLLQKMNLKISLIVLSINLFVPKLGGNEINFDLFSIVWWKMSFFSTVEVFPAQAAVCKTIAKCGGCGKQSTQEEFGGRACKCGRPLHKSCELRDLRTVTYQQCVLCIANEMKEKTDKSISMVKEGKKCSECGGLSDNMIVCDESCTCNRELPRKDGTHNYLQFCSKKCASIGHMRCIDIKGVHKFFCYPTLQSLRIRPNAYDEPSEFGFLQPGDPNYVRQDMIYDEFAHERRYYKYRLSIPMYNRKYIPLLNPDELCVVCKSDPPTDITCQCCDARIHTICATTQYAREDTLAVSMELHCCREPECVSFIKDLAKPVNVTSVVRRWLDLKERYTSPTQHKVIDKRFGV